MFTIDLCMFNQTPEIILVLGAAIFLLLVLGLLAIFSLVINNKRKVKHAREIMDVQSALLTTIARELHDNVGLLVSLARLNLQLAIATPAKSNILITETEGLLANTLSELKEVATLINSESIILNGIQQAIKTEVEKLQRTGVYDINYQENGTEVKMSPSTQILILRIFQESLQNIIKHAQATAISIALRYAPDFSY
ncbi:sensor histidine kinase [Paraflavitalea speifideaquila]|uniref:sensor histidine kinase n=1 Tax=Paraflavitalea speifideaquila TaxID=3076558 RepID=UPI0028E247B3|nr:histidine kinase [Paraflavitalea speifideiaquila]